MKEDHVSYIVNIQGIISHLEDQNETQSEMSLVIHSRLWVWFCFFLVVRHLSHHYVSYFFCLFSHASMDPAYFVKISSLLALSLRY